MTTLQDFRHSLSQLISVTRKRRQLQRELGQLAAMGDLDAVLADIGLVRSQIEPLIAGCGQSGEELDRMLARLGIDPATLPVESQRDMAWTCMNCADKGHCHEWLADRVATDYHAFCPNAPTLDDALTRQGAGAAAAAASASGDSEADTPYRPTADELRRLRSEAR